MPADRVPRCSHLENNEPQIDSDEPCTMSLVGRDNPTRSCSRRCQYEVAPRASYPNLLTEPATPRPFVGYLARALWLALPLPRSLPKGAPPKLSPARLLPARPECERSIDTRPDCQGSSSQQYASNTPSYPPMVRRRCLGSAQSHLHLASHTLG